MIGFIEQHRIYGRRISNKAHFIARKTFENSLRRCQLVAVIREQPVTTLEADQKCLTKILEIDRLGAEHGLAAHFAERHSLITNETHFIRRDRSPRGDCPCRERLTVLCAEAADIYALLGL